MTYGETTEVAIPVCGLMFPCDIDPRIHIDARITTRRALLETLAHEMVHQLQHERKLPLTHGRFFKAQAKRFAKYGLTL